MKVIHTSYNEGTCGCVASTLLCKRAVGAGKSVMQAPDGRVTTDEGSTLHISTPASQATQTTLMLYGLTQKKWS